MYLVIFGNKLPTRRIQKPTNVINDTRTNGQKFTFIMITSGLSNKHEDKMKQVGLTPPNRYFHY